MNGQILTRQDISWIVEGTFRQETLEQLKALHREMVAATRVSEPATLNYEWYIDPVKNTCWIYERYADSGAAAKHLAGFERNYAQRLGQLVSIRSITVMGEPGSEVINALGNEGVTYLSSLGGFAR